MLPTELQRKIDRRVLDRSKLLSNPDLAENLEHFGVSISTRNIHEIEGFISRKANFQMGAVKAHESSSENPSVILEHGASCCSLLLGVDTEGNIVSLHQSLVNEKKEDVVTRLNVSGFMEAVGKLGEDKLFFLTATGAGTKLPQRQALLDQLESILGQKVSYLFLNDVIPDTDEPPVTRLSRLKELTKNLWKGLIQTNDRLSFITEIFIIPAAVSTTSKTEVIIPRIKGEYYKTMTEAVANMRKKLGISNDLENFQTPF